METNERNLINLTFGSYKKKWTEKLKTKENKRLQIISGNVLLLLLIANVTAEVV